MSASLLSITQLSHEATLRTSNQGSALPTTILRPGKNAHDLDTLAELALDPKHTCTVFITHESLFVEICSRWREWLRSSSRSDPLSMLAALASILPYAPHLSVFVEDLLRHQHNGILQAFASRNATALIDFPNESLHRLLLALCRLLLFDNEEFAATVSPTQLQLILQHTQQCIRYLAIKLLCLYLHASESAMLKMLKRYCSEGAVPGTWEDKNIDYTFFSLWEERRLKDLGIGLEAARNAGDNGTRVVAAEGIIQFEHLSNTTACVGDVLVPRLEGKQITASSLVKTQTFMVNARNLAIALNGTKSVLVTGLSGAGKSSLIRYAAKELGKLDSLVCLHLNEQTDAKLLLGMYTTDNSPGSFTWRPGVLTRAVIEGRWVIIEDLDRAPIEILSTILPLLERRELLVPHWSRCIRAAHGFRMIATIRSYLNTRGDEVIPATSSLGFRHWLKVSLFFPSNSDLTEIIKHHFPILNAYVPEISRVYRRLIDRAENQAGHPRTLARPLGPQDLLRWCRRLDDLLLAAGIRSSTEPVSDALNDLIFIEAVDSFAGSLPDGSAKTALVDLIAQELHIPVDRSQYCLKVRRPEHVFADAKIRFGRISVLKRSHHRGWKSSSQTLMKRPFAMTTQALRVLESIAVAVKMAEPCLLVGETGTGKTTMIQHLADLLGYRLIVVNLSQQSEAGDLLGGYKPLNIRALAVPMKEEFDDLFEQTFSTKKNQQYVDTVAKAVSKGRWSRLLSLWQEALRMLDDLSNPATDSIAEPASKRRRLDLPKYQRLKPRWQKFATDVRQLQAHVASGPKGFAFSFVEGNIVKAARNGDWVLLDEINLASPDTLESLADLFNTPGLEEGPSLLLSETGDTQRIRIHKDFRIFGAMNPATDIGKKDLPASLRSRFFEIYIDSPDRDIDNLLLVVQAYLGSHIHSDIRVTTDVASLYLEIKRHAEQNRLVDGSNQKAHFSLRTLTRTLVYVTDITATYGLRRALYEGFSMSFLTLLNKESETILLPLIEKHLLGSQKNSRALLRQNPRPPQDSRPHVQFRHYWIAQGDASIDSQPHYIITPFIERNLLNLVRATSTRRFPVLLQGPTSSGKTSMIEYLAIISGNKFVRINNHEHTDLQEYLGSYVSGQDGRLHYQEGILVEALRNGHWIVLDELNLAPTDVLEALNRLLDDNKELLIPETQQVVKPHENFMLFATQNPPGMYGGRKILSRAFRNRFLELHFDDIPEDELEIILRERSQIAPSFCSRIVSVYKKLSVLRQRDRLFEQKDSFATLRDLFRWALRDADDREQLTVNGFLLLAERVRNLDERLAVKATIEDIMRVKIDEERLYATSSPLMSSILLPESIQDIVWTKSMRRLYILVTQALKRNEPVLLVGETGSGKTTICQVIAKSMNTELHIVNAHQNLETGDLIGSQRPVRNRASLELDLAQEITILLKGLRRFGDESESRISTLLEAYDAIVLEDPSIVSEEMRNSVEQKRARFKALFEWSDGSLVRAMRNGQPFLLDEISLADDSVLERLNSVLETNRTLILAEKGPTDTLVTASPGFQFLATMNPGGDYGKRELSPALRNRFTEIWVPHATDQEEILQIVKAKLLAPWVCHASAMVAFAAWFGATYNPGALSISIRDLLAWVYFVNKYHGPDPYLALLHGAAMVYVDGLGANPAAKISIPEAEIPTQRRACLIKLEAVFGHEMISLFDANLEFSLDGSALRLGPFSLEVSRETKENPNFSMQAPTAKANALKIVRGLQLPKPILIEGSPGVGKTALVVVLAQMVGAPLTRINLSEQTDLMDLFGSDVPVDGAAAGQFAWRDAPFLRAMQRGEWVLLDEMNLAAQAVLEGLNACLDHRGQVYISELDQTFTKHPKFTLFAAQNPHHQGCGRKGLPASFVNRFTVVYADPFVSQDLLIICNQNHPEYPLNMIESLTRCITDIGLLFQADRRLGNHGAPWEINLRDLLRWLHLVTSQDSLIAAGVPADFQTLLFSQRFRTAEDVTTVCNILDKHLPRNKQVHTAFHSTSPAYMQVGLGLLARDALLQSRTSQPMNKSHLNLPLMESIMICVQKSWPCLLVGPSGCGKTTLLFHLASLIGAEVVNLPLNAEMDSTDLIGGYEQVDTQREIVSIVQRLAQIIRTKLVEGLASACEINGDLIAIEQKLRAHSPDLQGIIDSIRKLDSNQTISDLSEIADECTNIIERSAKDNRACFEWVDGILVKALKQGQWLILDNANLCSPSVLDRLNSLLEPNGILSINEHRSLDGCAHDVTPHPNFRIFLVMDPRHGELSRAMRNRCIELFLSADTFSTPFNGRDSGSESSTSRLQAFGMFDWDRPDDAQSAELSSIFLDHLSIPDYRMVHRWHGEVAKGLVPIPSYLQVSLNSNISILHRILDSNGAIVARLLQTYKDLGEGLGLSRDFAAMQTIHPLNNTALISLTEKHSFPSNLRILGSFFELVLKTYQLQEKLDSIKRGTHSKPGPQMSRLERSLSSGRRPTTHDSSQPLAKFLQSMVLFMQESLDASHPDYKKGENIARDVLFYLGDMLDLGLSSNFDEGVFQAYLAIGRSIAAHGDHDSEAAQKISGMLSSTLDLFNAAWKLFSGLSMEILWQNFRPVTPKSVLQLDTCLLVEELMEKFDALKWGAGSSFRDLDLLRRSIVRMYDAISLTDIVSDDQIENIRDEIENLGEQSNISQASDQPHFRAEFEGLCQYEAFVDHGVKPACLDLLAGRSTKSLINRNSQSGSWFLLSKIAACTGIHDNSTSLMVIKNTLPCSLIQAMENISDVPLRCLASLRNEVDLITETLVPRTEAISQNHLHILNSVLATLQLKVYEVHEDKLNPSYLAECREYLTAFSQRSPENLSLISLPILSTKKKIANINYMNIITDESLDFSLQYLHASLKQGPQGIANSASAWIIFFTGLLHLYVPDRPFDPALKPVIERSRHSKRKAELETKLRALQEFSMLFSGQKSSLRSQLAENQLRSLGNEPLINLVARPQPSELGKLQGEFNNILKSIIQKSPNPVFLETLFQDQGSKIKEVELLRLNIAQAIFRLSANYRAYDDVTMPLVEMLHGLDTGLALSLFATNTGNQVSIDINQVCESTPLLGMRPSYFSRVRFEDLKPNELQKSDPRLSILNRLALSQSIDGNLDQKASHLMHEALLNLYNEWKEKLRHDQQKEAAKSSLYRYRGREEDNDDTDEENFRELFPDFDGEPKARNEANKISSKSSYNAKLLAQHIASSQREIFRTTKSPSEQILSLLARASRDIGSLWPNEISTTRCDIQAENFFCSIILNLASHHDQLNNLSKPVKTHDFYTKPNLAEVQKLIALMQSVQSRFLSLEEVWPEHATIKDVLRSSSELMALRHVEPLAKVITKAEQVHGYIHEWQVVASKQYSVAALYDQLTALLVNWRRLELSTWARLLDIEDKKCDEDAESWWFLAYEIIVAAPLSMIHSDEDLQKHVKELFATLEDFLSTTSIGQYSHRLRLIECFAAYLGSLAREEPRMKTVQNTLVNFLSYYSRFEKPIQETLHQGRIGFEKDLKEIVLLASWKDTNINALRDSAKRSHHKLFKVIRKYRAYLAHSADKSLGLGIPDPVEFSEPFPQTRTIILKPVDYHALVNSVQHLSNWQTKPARFTNPLSTAKSMDRMTESHSSAIDNVQHLEVFADDLMKNIKILQKETPAKATKENKEQIQHLKSRKKKLFADSLKDIRRMGFKSNVSGDALARQESMAVILANIPAFQSTPRGADVLIAEASFHKLLQVMPKVREQYHNHSEDLSHGEISRSSGYLESMLSVILKQRVLLVESHASLENLEKKIELMQNFSASQVQGIHRDDNNDSALVEKIRCTISWLPSIIEAGCMIIEKQAKLGLKISAEVVQTLTAWRIKIQELVERHRALPTLPIYLSSSLHKETYGHAKASLTEFSSELIRLSKENKNIGFVLRQILLWTEGDEREQSLKDTNGAPTMGLDEFDHTISNFLDSILVAIQHVQDILPSLPKSDEEIGWLLQSDTVSSGTLRALHHKEISHLLEEVISKLHLLDVLGKENFEDVRMLCVMALPIIQQYRDSGKKLFDQYAQFHRSLCRLAAVSAQSFCQVASQGFCSPSEDATKETGKSEKLEGGTGLGEGEGAEDISRDIQDDEDLTELAQEKTREEGRDEIEDQEDAVNMDQEELEGDMGDAANKEEGESGSDEGEDELDDVVGDVDDLDPTAVDEKLWDGNDEESGDEKKGSRTAGNKKKHEQVASDSDQKNKPENAEAEDDDDPCMDGAEEGEKIASEETEKLDPNLEEGQNLELPDDMDLDNGDQASVSSGSDENFELDLENELDDTQDQQTDQEHEELGGEETSEEVVQTEADPQITPEKIDGSEDNLEPTNRAGSPVDTEPDADEMDTEDNLLRDHTNNGHVDLEDSNPNFNQGLGKDDDQQNKFDDAHEKSENNPLARQGTHGRSADVDDPQAPNGEGQLGQAGQRPENAQSEERQPAETSGSQAFKKLGNALEKWHRQQQQIQDAQKSRDEETMQKTDDDIAGQEFEHLTDEDSRADTQALGAATKDQANALNETAFESDMQDQLADAFPIEAPGENSQEEDTIMEDFEKREGDQENRLEQSRPGAFMVEGNAKRQQLQDSDVTRATDEEEDIKNLDTDLSAATLQPSITAARSHSEALRLWTHYSSLTHTLSLTLTEQLRLVLAPTLATKMRGDFRTGKRLNIKRIIPYIASSYKRDKIWMRRSIPQKRAYQILLAVDDSKSMSESAAGHLAFETLALVAKSLSMLEVGQICVVGFGADVRVAHDFDKPFSSDAGVEIFRQFTFKQEKTDVYKLMEHSLTLLRTARNNKSNSPGGSGGDLWQLELIISDGVCEDHEAIRRLVRRAQEDHVVVVFVIVDAASKRESILDMSQAIFEPVAVAGGRDDGSIGGGGGGGGGGTKLRIKRYLDGFPFAYYLVVGEVRELPGVLATALRQWFAEVVEAS